MKDYYGILGIEKTATQEQIRSTYRKLALKWHPDKNKESGAEEKFKDITEAYSILSDANKKAQYDSGQEFNNVNFNQADQIFNEFFKNFVNIGPMNPNNGVNQMPFGFNFIPMQMPIFNFNQGQGVAGHPSPAGHPFHFQIHMNPIRMQPMQQVQQIRFQNGGPANPNGYPNIQTFTTTTQTVIQNGQKITKQEEIRNVNGKEEKVSRIVIGEGANQKILTDTNVKMLPQDKK